MTAPSKENPLSEVKLCLSNGDLDGAFRATKEVIKRDPQDAEARATLCALFAVSGELDRAQTQFEAQQQLGSNSLPESYSALLRASKARESVIKGESAPHFPNAQPEWFPDYQSALIEFSNGNSKPLLSMQDAIGPTLDELKGSNAEFEFEGFRNADARLFPFIEGVFDGLYSWVPIAEVAKLSLPERPELLQDLMWLPAIVMLCSSEVKQGFIFSSYPGSSSSEDDKVKLAMATTWDETNDEIDIGFGQQVFFLGAEAVPLFSIGQCQFANEMDSMQPSGH